MRTCLIPDTTGWCHIRLMLLTLVTLKYQTHAFILTSYTCTCVRKYANRSTNGKEL